MTLVRRRARGVAALVALVTAIAIVATASPAMAQTQTVTQADCDAGRVQNKQGETLRGKACERLVGRRVRLARTGFEVWWLLAGGVALMGTGAVLRMRRGGPAAPQVG
ncbi:MAG TPA: LPXTG cell wall anchor domain-containing protein [Thermoleophilaceae bacterium]|jgi:LPXTG-motif cell wall-anchored protein